MKEFIKCSAKILVDYLVSLLVFAIFIYVYMSIAGTKYYNTYLSFYCLLIFILTVYLIYADMKKLAEKEKRPQYDLHPYPLKGLIYGLIGFSPIMLLEIVSAIVILPDELAERIKHVFINALMGPPYFIIRFAGEAVWGYVLASLSIPLIAMLGYLAGHYGFEFKSRKKKELAQETAAFKKSPWNPTNRVNSRDGQRKKKVNTGNSTSNASQVNKSDKPKKPKPPQPQDPV